jgi:hypothetical protein
LSTWRPAAQKSALRHFPINYAVVYPLGCRESGLHIRRAVAHLITGFR